MGAAVGGKYLNREQKGVVGYPLRGAAMCNKTQQTNIPDFIYFRSSQVCCARFLFDRGSPA